MYLFNSSAILWNHDYILIFLNYVNLLFCFSILAIEDWPQNNLFKSQIIQKTFQSMDWLRILDWQGKAVNDQGSESKFP